MDIEIGIGVPVTDDEKIEAEVARIAKSEDVSEGVAAMREKRKPRFQGK